MKRIIVTTFLAATFFAAMGAAGGAFAQGNGQSNDRFVDVIVSLDLDHRLQPAATNKAMAAEVARGHGVAARATFGNVFSGFAVESCKGGSCSTGWDDDNGHGSHVAGTVGAIDNTEQVVGVAPGVTLHAVKVLDKRGSGSFSGIIEGIDWVAGEAAALGTAVVANMSLGGGGSKSGSCDNGAFTGDDNLHRAVCNAAAVGVVFAVAAGNDGADASGSVPAAYDDAVISVSATSSADDWPSWSNWGDATASWTANTSAPVAIAAPGVDVLSTWNDGGTNTISGTSMASPHAAGGAALFITSNPQAGDFSAFTNTRAGLLGADESTDGFSNTSGNPHAEDFLDAGAL